MKYILKVLAWTLAATLTATGCSSPADPSGSTISYRALQEKPLAEFPSENIAERSFVLFDDADPDFLFATMNSVKLYGERIYVLTRPRINASRLLVFDRQGHGLLAIDRTGQGPEEYTQISRFDVDTAGNIHIIDGRLDELIVYGPDGTFVRRQKLPYEVDDIRCLPGGDYLFVLCNWNTRQSPGRKAVVAAPDLTVKADYFQYGPDLDFNVILHSNTLSATPDEGAVLCESMNNCLYRFDAQGRLADSLRVDFGNRTIPEAEKSDVERNIWQNASYQCLSGLNTLIGDFVVGQMYSRRGFSYLIDRNAGIIYTDKGEKYDDALSFIVGFTPDGAILSVVSPEMHRLDTATNVPDEVKHHIAEDNFALCITQLKYPYEK